MDQLVEQLKPYSTSTLSDALDKLGIPGTCLGIAPLTFGFKTVGRAYTVKYGPVGLVKGTVGDYIDDVEPGQVVVLDNAGRTDCTVWGDILTTVAHGKGIAGTVIHGVCRDVPRSLELDYPIFSKGRFMRTGKDRVQVEGVNVPVMLSDIRVAPGDILAGDADGVVVIPQEKAAEVLELARSIEDAEDAIRAEVLKGASLTEVRRKFHYHELQRGRE